MVAILRLLIWVHPAVRQRTVSDRLDTAVDQPSLLPAATAWEAREVEALEVPSAMVPMVGQMLRAPLVLELEEAEVAVVVEQQDRSEVTSLLTMVALAVTTILEPEAVLVVHRVMSGPLARVVVEEVVAVAPMLLVPYRVVAQQVQVQTIRVVEVVAVVETILLPA